MKPRFTIRAILVAITLLCLWLGYSMNWIRQRRELIESGVVAPYERTRDVGVARAPGLLWLFGEPGYFNMNVEIPEDGPEMVRIRAIFPEADCWGNITPPDSR